MIPAYTRVYSQTLVASRLVLPPCLHAHMHFFANATAETDQVGLLSH